MHVIFERKSRPDADYLYEDMKIYRTKSGQYWIEGEGGAGTIWGKSDGYGGRVYGGMKRRLDPKKDRICHLNEAYRLGFDHPKEFRDEQAIALETVLKESGFDW